MSVDFEIRPNPSPVSAAERAALLANPGFGRVFTDHMVTVRYAEGKGWYDARVEARAPISVDPATAVLHYAQEIFEGLKAYHCSDGRVTMFRPEARAPPGGTGAAKRGGNHATSLIAQAQANEHGCEQALFLDAVARRYVDELSGMNVFFVYDDRTLVTPPLTGTILPGITRDS